MNFKKKSIVFLIFFILCVQILLFLNNRQKISFNYFIWNLQEVSVGKLICISFVSGFCISSFLTMTHNNEFETYQINEEKSRQKPR